MAKRKKIIVNDECPSCLALERKIEELTRTLNKYKKQTVKLRYKMNELENFAREADYLSKIVETLDEVEEEIEELSEDKLGMDKDEYIPFTRPDGKVVHFKKQEKLSYSRVKGK